MQEVIRFKGGSKFEAAINRIAEQAQKGGVLKVGFLENATYPDGEQVAEVAAKNEFGSQVERIPSRPFFRNAIANNKGDWGAQITKIMVATNYDIDQSLGLMGTKISGQIRKEITDFKSPRNALYTIAKKGFDKPLIDTSHMLNSVDYEITTDAEP
jgi:hypothetical protein